MLKGQCPSEVIEFAGPQSHLQNLTPERELNHPRTSIARQIMVLTRFSS